MRLQKFNPLDGVHRSFSVEQYFKVALKYYKICVYVDQCGEAN